MRRLRTWGQRLSWCGAVSDSRNRCALCLEWLQQAQPFARRQLQTSFKALRTLGKHIALLEMKMALAVLLGRFELASVTTPDGLPPRELLQLAMAPVGLSMKLRERRQPATEPA